MSDTRPELPDRVAEARGRIWDDHREDVHNSGGPKTREELRALLELLYDDAAAVTAYLDEHVHPEYSAHRWNAARIIRDLVAAWDGATSEPDLEGRLRPVVDFARDWLAEEDGP